MTAKTTVKITKRWQKTAEIYQHIGGEFTEDELEELYVYETFGKQKFAEMYDKPEPSRINVKKQLDLFIEEYIRPIKEGWFTPEEMYMNEWIDQKLLQMVMPPEYQLEDWVVRALRRWNPQKEYDRLVVCYGEFQQEYRDRRENVLRNCERPYEPNEKEQRRLMMMAVKHFEVQEQMQEAILRTA